VVAPVAARPLPQAWRRRIATHRASRLAGRAWRMSIAAGLVFALLAGGRILLPHGRGSTLAEADAAHDGTLPTLRSLKIGALAQSATDAALAASLGMNIRAPDLARFGYRLAGVDFYRGPAAGLIYRNAQAATLTIYVRRSNGEARFDLLRRGKLRVCIWQDEVVSAVMEGDMSAGEMMRVASAAYSDLNL
jgi:anti-sigma factor RsiW